MGQRNREHREIFRDWQIESERVQRYIERVKGHLERVKRHLEYRDTQREYRYTQRKSIAILKEYRDTYIIIDMYLERVSIQREYEEIDVERVEREREYRDIQKEYREC